jgi:pyruvate dehydrogenase E2 component (dihydrolipoamide acetyltransferase)
MERSHSEIPSFFVETEVDVTELQKIRERLPGTVDPRPSITDFLIKGAAQCLTRHPRLNSVYDEGVLRQNSEISIGFAVAAADSLLVPRIENPDGASVGSIAHRTRDLIARARIGALMPAELENASFTISNLGMMGAVRFTAIINPPQTAILTVGAIRRVPVFDDAGDVVAREVMSVGLVSDHRVIYGAHAAAFLQDLRETLEEPTALIL